MQNIHDIHMKVSYDQNHPIHIYVEDYVNQSQNFVLDRTLTISINRFARYDMSLCFFNNQIYQTKELFVDSFNHYFFKENNTPCDKPYQDINDLYVIIENDQPLLTKPFDISVLDIVASLIKSYEEIINSSNSNIFETLCLWIYHLYDGLKNIKSVENVEGDENVEGVENAEKNKCIGTLYFLGLLEWFHLLVIDTLYCQINKKTNDVCTIVWSEENMIELENLSDLSIDEIRNYLICEYSSHSTLYMIDQNNISIYNPDDDYNYGNDNLPVERLCKFMSKKYLLIESDESIQSIIDDQYCIFHCVNFLLRFVNAIDISANIYSEKTLKIFMKYVDDMNQITKKSDIHTFIKDLLLKSSLHCLLKEEGSKKI